MSRKKGQIPFDKDGNLLWNSWEISGTWVSILKADKIWLDRFVFTEDLKIGQSIRGRSSVRVWVETKRGQRYNLTLDEFIKVTKQCHIQDGVILGSTWKFHSHAGYYSIKLVEEEDE